MRFALFLAVAALAGCTGEPPRPNLVLLSVDTLRADHLSCYGSDSISTPHFDRLAREGVLFEDVSTVAPTTLPAHASLLTGVSPAIHGARDNVGFRVRDDIPTLATILKEAGYRTGGFVGSFVLDSRFGLARGFDVYSDEMPETERGLLERRGDAVLKAAMDWIDGDREGPFFAFLHFYDPHRPYDPPEAFGTGGEDLGSGYRGEVLYVDSLLGTLLDFLEARGLSDSTAVVVTADHGESLGEHGEDTHGFFLYQATLRVPLLVRAPSLPAGRRIPDVASAVDVAPTVLEILGVEAPAGFDGVSLFSAPQERDVYAESFLPRLHYGWSELRSLRRRNWKLVLAPRAELYDLQADSGEERNLILEQGTVASDLREALEKLEEATDPLRPEPLDEKALSSLRALGYLGGAEAETEGSLADPKDQISIYNEILDLSVVGEPTREDVVRIRAVLEQEPRNPRALSLGGRFLLDVGRPDEAKAIYSRLIEVQPGGFEGHLGLGRALLDLREIEAARASLEKARTLDPGSSSPYSSLAALAKLEGDHQAAERWLREGIALEPRRSLYQALADLLVDTGRVDELSVLAAEWQGPGAESVRSYASGQLLASQGNVEGALVELARALALAPADDNVEQALANSLSRVGRFEEAMRHYQAILARTPCYLGALTNLGAIYERRGDVDEGIRRYETAIRCDPEYANAYRNLGAALARKGDLKRALEALRKARSLSPGDEELRAAIAELESLTR
jgi:arylsulfatase A-like enzyme/Flp pilus assembly protein TadD